MKISDLIGAVDDKLQVGIYALDERFNGGYLYIGPAERIPAKYVNRDVRLSPGTEYLDLLVRMEEGDDFI